MKKSFYLKWVFFTFFSFSLVQASDAFKPAVHTNSEHRVWERLYGYHARLNEAVFKLDESNAKAISSNSTAGKELLLDRSIWPFSSKKVQPDVWYDEDLSYQSLLGQKDAFGVTDLYGLRLVEAFWGLKALTANGYFWPMPNQSSKKFRSYECRGRVCGMPESFIMPVKEGATVNLPLVVEVFLMGFDDPKNKVPVGKSLFTFVAPYKNPHKAVEKDKKVLEAIALLSKQYNAPKELRFSEGDQTLFARMEGDVLTTVSGLSGMKVSTVEASNLNTNGTGFGGYMQWLMRQAAESAFSSKDSPAISIIETLIRFKKTLKKGDHVATFARQSGDFVRVILFKAQSKEPVAWGQYKVKSQIKAKL